MIGLLVNIKQIGLECNFFLQTLPVITYFYLWSLVYLHMLHYYDIFLQILFIYLGNNERKKRKKNIQFVKTSKKLILYDHNHEILMGFSWSCHNTRTCLNFANLYVLWFHEFLKYFLEPPVLSYYNILGCILTIFYHAAFPSRKMPNIQYSCNQFDFTLDLQ